MTAPLWKDDLKHFVRYDESGNIRYVIALSNRIHPISDVPVLRHYWEWMKSQDAISSYHLMISWHAIICDMVEEHLQRDIDYTIISMSSVSSDVETSCCHNIWEECISFMKTNNIPFPASEQLHKISRGLYNRDFHLLCDKDKSLLLMSCIAQNDGFAKKRKLESHDSWIIRYREWVASGKRIRALKRRKNKNQIRHVLQQTTTL